MVVICYRGPGKPVHPGTVWLRKADRTWERSVIIRNPQPAVKGKIRAREAGEAEERWSIVDAAIAGSRNQPAGWIWGHHKPSQRRVTSVLGGKEQPGEVLFVGVCSHNFQVCSGDLNARSEGGNGQQEDWRTGGSGGLWGGGPRPEGNTARPLTAGASPSTASTALHHPWPSSG